MIPKYSSPTFYHVGTLDPFGVGFGDSSFGVGLPWRHKAKVYDLRLMYILYGYMPTPRFRREILESSLRDFHHAAPP